MSTHTQARTRIGTLAVLVTVLVKTLTPGNASTAFAAAPAQANLCTNFSATAQTPIVVNSADEQVNIPAETVNQALYHMAWLPKDDQQRFVYNGVMDTLLRYSGLDRGTDEYVNYANAVEYQLKYNLFVNSSTIVNTMLNTALDTPAFARYVPDVWGKLQRFQYEDVDPSLDGIVAADAIASSARSYRVPDAVVQLANESFIELYDCAQKNPQVAKIVDAVHGRKVNFSVRDTAKTIIAKNPDLPVLKEIRDGIGPDGSLNISLNQLTDLTKAEFGKLNDTLGEIKTTVKDIDERQKVIVDYLSNQAEKQAAQEEARKKAEAFQLKITAAQAGLSILTTITAKFSPQRAKQLSVTGNALIQTVQAVNGWLKATAGQDGLNKIFSLSSVVMTGNVLGAAMSVVSLFGRQEPPPEQIILEEIGKLRQQVSDLRVEMHERFDRIDQNLNSIYTTMQQRFDQIDIQLGKINGNISDVQQSLMDLDLKLSRIERNNFEFLNDLGRRPLLDAINGGLKYQTRTGQPMPYQPEFVNFENVLQGWGTIHAFDSVNAGPQQRDYSDAQMLSELSAYPIDANINYVNGWMQAHGLPAISSKRLPSPRDWMFAIRAYNQLALEWPQHMNRIDPQRQEALNQIGLDLEAAMGNLSSVRALSGTTVVTTGNQLLYTSVVSNYQNKVDALDAGIASVENTYMNEVRVSRLGRAEPFDIHGYIYQKLTFRSPEATTAKCLDPNGYAFQMPNHYEQRIPDFDFYTLAEYLNLGKLQTCIYDIWSNPVTECYGGTCYQVADHDVTLRVMFANRLLMSQTLPGPRTRIPEGGNWIRDNWTTQPWNYLHAFTVFQQIDTMTPQQEAIRQQGYDIALQKVETELLNYQHELYGHILNEMKQGSLKSLVAQVAGSKALIDTVVALGLPRAVNNDEFLHAMLYGNQQLVDDQQLAQGYALKISQAAAQTRFTDNPRALLGLTTDQRRDVFSGLVNSYLNAITANEHAEAADYIADTRNAMKITMNVVKIQSGAAQANKTIYLPLVRR